MKLFDRAIIKLTIIYSAIILLICVGFSGAFFATTTNRFEQAPIARMPVIDDRSDVIAVMHRRDNEIKQQLLTDLIVVNAIVITCGIITSYFLARRTLKPIRNNIESQKQFVANASHELRTPLSAISIENEVLLREKTLTKDQLVSQIQSNLEETKKLQRLTSNLLELSHDDDVVLTKISIKPLAEEAICGMKKTADIKNIRIFNNTKPIQMTVNRKMLVEIISILIENAVKYSPEKSKILLKTEHDKIMIIDEGCGIDDEDLPHIFERFYRAEKSHTTDGYGLGLSLAHHLAERMNLNVTAKNNSNKGTTFTIS